jgi:nitroimidazol reductase NimA-like FMN-containing flavoprotein (pyridoxamine 5'-phosphate oxidase superfamily)
MFYGNSVVTELSDQECREKLAAEVLGRLALHVRNHLDLFPINFVYQSGDIFFRTAPGTKLLELTINTEVVFEIDGYSDSEAWSVIARGIAERLEHDAQIDEANEFPLHSFIPTLKLNWVRIHITGLSGRYFGRAPEPELL